MKSTTSKQAVSQHPDYAEEKLYLESVLEKVKAERKRLTRSNVQLEEQDQEIKARAWEEHLELKDGANSADSAVVQEELRGHFIQREQQLKRLRELEAMASSPYFARIDYRFEDEDEMEPFYIGLHPLLSEDCLDDYVIDWRAPIASLYYEAEAGEASYLSPSGEIRGVLGQKKQLVITGGKLRQIFDAGKELHDEHLHYLLSRRSGAKMRQIVASIQSEQNRLIRLAPEQSLLVQGVPGSGKTSVALHRLAYTLYQKADLQSAECLIVSPNEAFSDYIAELLPTLAEEEVRAESFCEIMKQRFSRLSPRLAAFHYAEASRERREAVAGPEIGSLLGEFAKAFAQRNWQTQELKLTELSIDEEEIESILPGFKNEPHFNWGELLADELKRRYSFSGEGREELRQALQDFYEETDIETIYQQFLQSVELKERYPALAQRSGHYDRVDLDLMLYLADCLWSPYRQSKIKQLIVDEFQDLTLIEHWLLANCYLCPRSLYGDLRQAIRFSLPAGYLDMLKRLYRLKEEACIELNISYRSSEEITHYAAALIADDSIQAFARQTEPVLEQSFHNFSEQQELIMAAVQHYLEQGQRRIAILLAEPDPGLVTVLEPQLDVLRKADRLLADEEPLCLLFASVEEAKGLEYDAVIIADRNSFAEASEFGRQRLFVALSRALHGLTVLSEAVN